MFQAIVYSAIAASALLIGAFIANTFRLSTKVVAAFMAFGSGVLICALTFGLMEEAFNLGGFDAIIIGFICGGLVFIGGDWWLHKIGARKYQKNQMVRSEDDQSGKLIVLGMILDGVPESIALGVTLFLGGGVGILMATAIFLSNFPESIAAGPGLLKEGYSRRKIYWFWLAVSLATILVTLLSYLFLRDIDPNITGILESFAAGAILAMLADTMMPEAYAEGGFSIAAMTILGFLVAFIISRF